MRSDVNPWLAMWGHPRNTIRAVVSSNPRYGVVSLATIYALQGLFYFSSYWSLGLSYPFYAILVAILLLAPFFGLGWVYLWGWVIRLTGRWLEGKAPLAHLRAAAAWSKIPTSINLVMWFILLFANPDYVFILDAGGPTLLFINFIAFILSIWSFVLLVQSIREVQGFSVSRTIINLLLAWVVFSILVFFLFAILRFIYIRMII